MITDLPAKFLPPRFLFHKSYLEFLLAAVSLLSSSQLLQLQLLLRSLLPARDDGLGADAAEHQRHTEPLPAAQPVAEPHHGEDHREHLPRHGNGHEEERGECRERVDCVGVIKFKIRCLHKGEESRRTDEDLAYGTTHREAHDVVPHARVPAHEPQGGSELAAVARVEVHAEVLANTSMDEVRGEGEVGECQQRAEEVVGAHHGGALVRRRQLEDVILRGVREPVEQQVDRQEEQAPRHIAIRVHGRLGRLRRLGARVQRKDCHAASDG